MKMNIKAKRTLVFGLTIGIPTLLSYLCGSFTAFDFNPSHWEPVGRFFCVLAAVVSSIFATCIAADTCD